MVISGLYMFLVQFMSVILFLGYDVPTCGSRVPFCIFCACLFTVSIYDVDGCFLIGVMAGVAYTDIYTYYWSLGLAESRHLAYLYVLVACFVLRCPVPIFGPGGLLSVKQMDPVSFSAEIENLFGFKNDISRK